MKIIDSSGRIDGRTAAALGIFDGVHLGHRSVLGAAVERARELGVKPAVFTFRTSTVTSKGRVDAILTDEDKLAHFEELGADNVCCADFAELKELTPEQFVRDILAGRMHTVCVVCGENFHFGRGGTADVNRLRELCAEQGIEVRVVPPLKIGGERVSTTRIRELIRSGGIAVANALLGYRFTLKLEVVHGAELARTWDFPTINQEIPARLLKPRFGVYCVKVRIDGGEYAGVCNVGIKPTVGRYSAPLAETFIIGYNGNAYGQTAEVEFCEFVRPEMKFESFDDLRAEITRNTEFTKKYFGIQ